MASAQVLKKQEHLEAGKRKLEEFRRKKAAEKAKKASSTSQVHVYADINEKKPSEHERVRLTDSNGVGASDALAQSHFEPSSNAAKIAIDDSDTSRKSDFSSSDMNAKPSHSARINDLNATVLERSYLNDDENKDTAASVGLDGFGSAKDKFEGNKDYYVSSVHVPSVVGNDYSSHFVSPIQEDIATGFSTSHALDKYPFSNIDGPEMDLSSGNSGTFADSTTYGFPVNSFSTLLPDKLGSIGYEDNKLTSSSHQESLPSTSNVNVSPFGFKQKFSAFSDMRDERFGGAVDHIASMNHSPSWTSNNRYADYNYDAQSSSNHAPPSPRAARRSRPSFLDSIQVTKGTSPSSVISGTEKTDISSSKVYPFDGLGSSVSQTTATTSVTSANGVGLFNQIMENKNDFFPQKQNEDFAALEQHIEDLTQEKFSLQHALEASRALAESLASENSALTESFNQQGSVVNHLKFELEKLQEEIKAQLAELEAVKMEYANAQLECNAADERAKLLASEVIGLEEKALRLRSNELKLERQLENTQAEISSYRKKMSSLEKDHQDLLSTIDALQEEKKLLQSKLRKASSSGKSTDLSKTSYTKKDVSTSTEGLGTTTESANSGTSGTAFLADEDPSSQFSPESIQLSLEGLPVAFPSDQLRMIQNINTLIAELALEKDQLTHALSVESSQSSKLLELNKELTRRLEAQTQRLELLTAQSMANDNSQPRQLGPRVVHENTTYADEGDEVVERVLGWIMKLFPGGPSRRRPIKHF